MRFAVVVQGTPFSGSSYSAYHFAEAVISTGHELYRVFFYQDGVYNGNVLAVPPQDEWDISSKWAQLHEAHEVELIVCIASSLRRGLLDAAEAERYEKAAHNLGDTFEISGLGQLIDAALNADRVVTFGPG